MGRARFIDMPVVNRMEHRRRAVIAVGVGSQLMFHIVALKIAPLAHFNNAVLRHRGVPQQVAAGRV